MLKMPVIDWLFGIRSVDKLIRNRNHKQVMSNAIRQITWCFIAIEQAPRSEEISDIAYQKIFPPRFPSRVACVLTRQSSPPDITISEEFSHDEQLLEVCVFLVRSWLCRIIRTRDIWFTILSSRKLLFILISCLPQENTSSCYHSRDSIVHGMQLSLHLGFYFELRRHSQNIPSILR